MRAAFLDPAPTEHTCKWRHYAVYRIAWEWQHTQQGRAADRAMQSGCGLVDCTIETALVGLCSLRGLLYAHKLMPFLPASDGNLLVVLRVYNEFAQTAHCRNEHTRELGMTADDQCGRHLSKRISITAGLSGNNNVWPRQHDRRRSRNLKESHIVMLLERNERKLRRWHELVVAYHNTRMPLLRHRCPVSRTQRQPSDNKRNAHAPKTPALDRF